MPYDNELFAAIHKNQTAAVIDALARGASANAKDNSQDSPLHIAAEHDIPDIISSLLEHGASCDAERSNKDKPIHIAAMCNSTKAISLILAKDKNQLQAIGREGRTPFLYSAGANAIEAMQLFIENGADVNELPIESGKAAIHIAAINNKPDIIQLLIKNGANVDQLSSSRQTPLKFCIVQRNPSLEAAKMLLENGATANLDELLPLIQRQKYSAEKKNTFEALLKSHASKQEHPSQTSTNQKSI